VFLKKGIVTEGTHPNVFIVIGNALITHPSGNDILSGVTLQVIIGLAEKAGLTPLEYPFSVGEMVSADEVFLAGTTVGITPVVKVLGESIQHSKPWVKTIKLQALFKALNG
jgi:D-alanine transaminase